MTTSIQDDDSYDAKIEESQFNWEQKRNFMVGVVLGLLLIGYIHFFGH